MDIKKWEDLAKELYRIVSNTCKEDPPKVLDIHYIPGIKVMSISDMISIESYTPTNRSALVLERDFHIGGYHYITNIQSLTYMLYLYLGAGYHFNNVIDVLRKHGLLLYYPPF